MAGSRRKLQLLLSFTTLLLIATAIGCRGFFRDPQLTSITVGPQGANIQQGTTLPMSAQGNFDDGSTNTLTSGVLWSSSDTAVAPITQGGIVTGASAGTSTISAAKGAITGTTTITVSLNNVTAVKISPTSRSIPVGGTTTYQAFATVSGQQVDISSSVTWTVTTTSGGSVSTINITNGVSPATVTVNAGTASTDYNVNVTYTTSTQTFTDTATLTVQ